jgi:hypothetical protein
MNHAIRRPLLRVLALGAFLCAMASTAHAQFETTISLNKGTYLTLETVEATVNISNRSGADVVMGGPNGMAWLSFEVNNPQGQRVPAVRFRGDETLVFKSGASISKTIKLSDYHSFSDYGIYSITAAVYHPPSQQYFASNRVRANFTDSKPFWGPNFPFGVPMGLPGAGQIRHYELSVVRDTQHTYLYVRLIDEKTKLKLSTFALGTCIMVTDPQVSLDRDNMLHVLFMTKPHIYIHAHVDTQGHLVKTALYKEEATNRPQLVVGADQTVGVQGGSVYDPAAEAARLAPVKGRSIREKPPGL